MKLKEKLISSLLKLLLVLQVNLQLKDLSMLLTLKTMNLKDVSLVKKGAMLKPWKWF